MALEKTYQYTSNTAIPVIDTIEHQNGWFVWWMKQFLTGALSMVDQSGAATASPSGLWTVAGSSDGVNGAMDGVDRLGTTFDETKFVWGSSNTSVRSWIVLQNTSLGIYICIDLFGQYSGRSACTWMSTTLPTGGSSSSAPSASPVAYPSQTGPIDGVWAAFENTIGAGYIHGILATDGSFLVFDSRSGLARFASAFGALKLSDTMASDSAPCIFGPLLAATSDGNAQGALRFPESLSDIGMLFMMSVGPNLSHGTNKYGVAAFDGSAPIAVTAITSFAYGTDVATNLGARQRDGLIRKQELWVTESSSDVAKGRVSDIFLTQLLGDGATVLDANGNVEFCQAGICIVPAYTALSV